MQKALRLLMNDLRHPSLRVKKMEGHTDIFEARASRDIRITFEFSKKEDNTLTVRACGHHDETLKNP